MTKSLPPLEAWQTRQLRLTVFPGPAFRAGGQNWWQDLFHEPSASVTRSKSGEVVEHGPFENGTLTLGIHPLRIDWIYSATGDTNAIMDGSLPVLGTMPVAVETFNSITTNWLQMVAPLPLLRIAFGAVLIQPVGDKQEAFNNVMAYLPFDVPNDPDNTDDFLYQINRRKLLSLTDQALQINRLSKWSSANARAAVQTLTPPGIPQLSEPLHFSQLELDINTDPEYSENIQSNNFEKLYRELVKMGQEIATNGDVP